MRRRTRLQVGIAGALAMLAVPFVGSVGAVEAAWTDSEHASSSLQAGAIGALTKVGCTRTSSAATATWTNPAATGTVLAPTTWTVTVTYSGGTAPSPSPAAGATSVTFNASQYGQLLGLGNTTFSYSIVGSRGTWTTPAITGTFTVNNTLVVSSIVGCT